MKKAKEKRGRVRVSKHALIQRINRKLEKDDEVLRTSRSERMEMDVGHFYILDFRGNYIARKDVDIEELGRELGVLKAYESFEDD